MISSTQKGFQKKKSNQQKDKNIENTPGSPNIEGRFDVNNLSTNEDGLFKQLDAFIIGICGGDCAGKKELLNYMFDEVQKGDYYSWRLHGTQHTAVILSQSYFISDQSKRFQIQGTDWQTFYKKILSLSIGNQIRIKYNNEKGVQTSFKVRPAKIICVEGSHIFKMNVNKLLNLKVFIDSDSDTRLSRRVYKDTMQNKMTLNQSIDRYLNHIKISYEKDIEPYKKFSDLIMPHFGNGYDDHTKNDRNRVDKNIINITQILISRIKSAQKFYEDKGKQQDKTETETEANIKTEDMQKTKSSP